MSAQPITREQVEAVVLESIRAFVAEPADVIPDATFEALDVDSLDLAELSQIVHEKLGVELKASDIADIKTVADTINLIESRV